MSKELCSIREWTPLNLNELIPSHIQRGLFSTDVKFTCADAIREHLAIGSDVGIVFWYNRHTGAMQKLRAEVSSRVTCVSIVDSVEYMIAAGHASGQVSVFQIQKPLPPDLNLVAKPIERYTIRDLHRTPVTCCEWSKNGMKLYSGDRQGIVVLTEFDYQTHQSKSVEILSEAYEIVQLSVYQCYLLVSTLYRAVVCQFNSSTQQWQIKQVGKKDRKQLVDCGGIFLKRNPKHPQLISGRPGLRFWLADTEGNVEKTLLFRDAVARSPTWEIPILNPKNQIYRFGDNPATNKTDSSDSESQGTSNNFRNFYLYGEDALIVTHDEYQLYILNLDRLRVEAVARGFRKILDFCVCDKEIFVLEGERSLLRLAPLPERPNKAAKIIFNPTMPPPVPFVSATAGLYESPVEYEPDQQTIVSAEECFELPPIETLHLNIPIELAVESPRAEQNRRLEIFNQISQQDFDESILHSSGLVMSGRRKHKSKSHERQSVENGIVEIGHVVKTSEEEALTNISAKEKPTQTTLATQMDVSFCVAKTVNDSIKPTAPVTQNQISKQDLLTEDEAIEPNLTLSTPPPRASSPKIEMPTFSLAYPQHAPPKEQTPTRHEDAGVQTTPRKKHHYNEETELLHDYSAGQPVDDLCQALRATTLIEDIDYSNNQSEPSNQPLTSQRLQLQFITTQPQLEEIHSFLPDFSRLQDPQRRSPSNPPSNDSGTSSEWEFLDN